MVREPDFDELYRTVEQLQDEGGEDDGGLDVTINSHRVTEDDIEEAGGEEKFSVEDIDREPVRRTVIEDLGGEQQASTTYPREDFEPGELTGDDRADDQGDDDS